MSVTMIPPVYRPPRAQSMSALAQANRVRIARAALLQRLELLPHRQGCRRAADLIADPPDVMMRLEVSNLLRRISTVARSSAERITGAADVRSNAHLGSLTLRQRAALEAALRYRAGV